LRRMKLWPLSLAIANTPTWAERRGSEVTDIQNDVGRPVNDLVMFDAPPLPLTITKRQGFSD